MSREHVEFRVSIAGVAGDPEKLLYATFQGSEWHEMFNGDSLRSLRRVRKKILKRIELETGVPDSMLVPCQGNSMKSFERIRREVLFTVGVFVGFSIGTLVGVLIGNIS
jgi:hypothetical protein